MQNQVELAEQIQSAINLAHENGDEITLFDVVKKVIPELDDYSIKTFFSYIVNGQAVKDWSIKVSPSDVVKVVPQFAGGCFN